MLEQRPASSSKAHSCTTRPSPAGKQPLPVSNFNTVLGTTRGSVLAQTQRDTEEREHKRLEILRAHQQELTFFAVRTLEDLTVLPRLIQAYAVGDCNVDGSGYQPLVDSFAAAASQDTTARSLAIIAAGEDPELAPGLTFPAIAALSKHFTDNSDPFVPFEQRPLAIIPLQAEYAITKCFPSTHDLGHYQHRSLLCVAVGLHIEKGLFLKCKSLCLRAAQILERAPTSALAGPLNSWVAAFIVRYDSGNLLDSETQETLRRVCCLHSGSAGATAALSGQLHKLKHGLDSELAY